MMGRTEEYKPDQIIEALIGAGGLINLAAKSLGCDWHTVKRYMDEYPEVQEAADVANELQLDISEGTIFRLRDKAESENVKLGAAKYHLTKKGVKRGYGDRFDVTSDGEKLEGVQITIKKGDE